MVSSQMLESMGFDVLTANDGEQAVHVYCVHQDKLRTAVCDLTMPGADDEQTFREIRAFDGKACVDLMSGFNEQEAATRFMGMDLAGFLQKPFTIEEMRDRLANFLNSEAKNQARARRDGDFKASSSDKEEAKLWIQLTV